MTAAAVVFTPLGLAFADNEGDCAGRSWHAHGPHGNPLERISDTLTLTPEQKAKVQPIIDQAKPQIAAIHQEAMQKAKTVMDNTMAQIRPLLTAEQQKKADEIKAAHEQMRDAAKKLHEATKS
jgi:Spy/CpxP family protein refolding chaperone